MISVIIPSVNDPDLQWTINNIIENAEGEIEIIVVIDGGQIPSIENAKMIIHNKTLGMRVSTNEAARIAQGDYLFMLDAHCSMSRDWDKKLSSVCGENTIVVSTLRAVDDDWNYKPGIYSFCSLNRKLIEKWWDRKPLDNPVEETMAFTGCAWMIRKDYYWQIGGYDESFGFYGYNGPEWSLKVWLHPEHPGRILLRTDVICGHKFGTNNDNRLYPVSMISYEEYFRLAMAKWGKNILKLVERFAPVPDWKDYSMEKKMVRKKKVFKTTIRKKDDDIERDSEGNIISHKVKYYEPYTVEHDGSKSMEQIEEENLDNITKVEREEVLV